MHNLNELRQKPLFALTLDELLFAIEQTIRPDPVVIDTTANSNKYVYGLAGIQKIFDCSRSTANRIKQSGKINKAITQTGRTIVIDVDLALKLAGNIK